MWVHRVHMLPQDSTVPTPPGIRVLCWGPAPPSQLPNLALPVRHVDHPHPGKQEEWHLKWDRLSLQIVAPSGLPSTIGHQHLTLHAISRVLSHHHRQRLSYYSGAPLRQRLKHYICHQGRDPSSGRGQTRIHPRRCWDALSPLWRSHGHAHRGGPILNPRGQW